MRGPPPLNNRKFTLIELMIVIAIIAIIVAIAIPSLIEARKHANEAAGIEGLKTITTAQSFFREGDKDGNNTPDYGTLTQLSDQNLIDSVLGSGRKQGYSFSTMPGATATALPIYTYWALANPIDQGGSGDRGFVTNHEGAIHYTSDAPATINLTDLSIPPGHSPLK